VNPAEIEERLLHFPGVRQAVAFGRPADAGLRNEEVAACVVANVDLRENELMEFCPNSVERVAGAKRIFIVDSIPTNERGKISRRDWRSDSGTTSRCDVRLGRGAAVPTTKNFFAFAKKQALLELSVETFPRDAPE